MDEETRQAQIDSGSNRHGALTITMCPGCGKRTRCKSEAHMCRGEHFQCSSCEIKWDTYPPKK